MSWKSMMDIEMLDLVSLFQVKLVWKRRQNVSLSLPTPISTLWRMAIRVSSVTLGLYPEIRAVAFV